MRKMFKSTKSVPLILIALIMALIIPLSTIGCSDEGTTIIMQSPYAETDVTGQMAKRFKALVEEKTDVSVELFFDGSLVSHDGQFEGLRTGLIDAAIQNQGYCRAVNVNFDFSGVLQGLIITQTHGDTVYSNAEYRTFIDDLFADYDITFLDYIPSYLVFGYFANFPIDSVRDVEGQKIFYGRPGTLGPAMSMLGADELVYVAWADFPAAVQNGQIDVQLTPVTIAPYTGTTDVFDYVCLRPFYNTNMVLISDDKWNDISDADQETITDEIMPEVIEYTQGIVIQQHIAALELIKTKLGADNIAVQSAAEEEEMWNELKVYPAFLSDVATMDSDIYDLILDLRPTYTDYDPAIKQVFTGADIPY